jgi:IS30 family transposase
MDQLEKLYYDPTKGFLGFNRFYALVRENNNQLSKKEIKKWYDEQSVNQVYRSKTRRRYNEIICKTNLPGCIQVDLQDISKFAGNNNNNTFLVNVVDVYSRYAWSFPIKHKSAKNIRPHIKTVLEQIKQYPLLTFTSDQGSEFKGSVSKLLKEYNVKQYLTDKKSFQSKNKTFIVERFNN